MKLTIAVRSNVGKLIDMIKTSIAENQDGKFIVIDNDTLGQHITRGERWEEHFTRWVAALVKPGDVAVDIGANIGYNAIILGRAVGDSGVVIAFEPLRITFQQLCGNVVLNGLTNVFPHHCAIGSADRVLVSMAPVDYNQPNINIMNSTIGIGGEYIEMRTLDSFALPRVDLVKIDIQGCELVALKGAVETLTRCRPLVIIEIEEPQLKHHNTSPVEVMSFLINLNYTLAWSASTSVVDWIAVPTENPTLLNRVRELLGPDCKVVPNPD